MKIDVNETLKALSGETLMDTDSKGTAIEATIKAAIVNALLTPAKSDNGIDKVKKYDLANRVYKAENEIELTVEEAALIKERVGEAFGAIVVGQIWGLLDGR